MRRVAVTYAVLGSLIAAGCAPTAPESADVTHGEAQTPISWGTSDGTGHPAVVALLTAYDDGTYSECSGSIVKQAGGYGYVLTAAHCCYDVAPQIVTTNSDYSSAVNALYGGSLGAGVYKIDTTSVRYHASFSMNALDAGHDFCMFKFATSNTLSVLQLPTSGTAADGLANNVAIEHVGYGTTNNPTNNTPNPNNSVRNKGTNTVDYLDNSLILYEQGGTPSNHIPGTCQGDSGGPALVPAGAPQSQQVVVGVTSFGGADAQGNAIPCGQADQGGADRVRFEIGSGKFITSFLNDMPIGTKPGTAVPSCGLTTQDPVCTTCIDTSCCAQSSACANSSSCIACLGTNPPTSCNNNSIYQSLLQCVGSACNAQCGGGGGAQCGFQVQDATCNSCMEASCCNQATACSNNTTCFNCLSNPTASCNTNTQYKNIINCLGANCSTECGISTSSSSSSSSGSTSSSSSSSSSGSASSSSGSASSSSSSSASSGAIGTGGAGTGGAPQTGGAGGMPVTTTTTATNTDGSNDANQDSGCSVSTGSRSAPEKDASMIAMLVGAAVAFVRRRKAA